MDIPSTGAVFTLGESHLAENTQSYFYIKNDPVKSLISGPHQSAVICESGRLFVWGENHYGQLGIGSNGGLHNSNTSGSKYVTKPTCVKTLKMLGLKIADVTFGIGWAVLLTHSNELFFTGRNIFPEKAKVSENFITANVNKEEFSVIHKPFRLNEFDDCFSKNEEEENFVTVQSGNDHFAALTSFGRLIGWGSNDNYQLGTERQTEGQLYPIEISNEANVQQFACGPYSTVVLTNSHQLYLTGRLNEFVFPQLTELQHNLSTHDYVISVYVSPSSEIYIITNSGSIYRSIESLRQKSLIFQPFYDYNSEENGSIFKLQRGASFYAVLTKAHKLFTTFSESGHHLKTFREISKFKNLRLLDMAVGEEHILVHGIPKAKTVKLAEEQTKRMSSTFVLPHNGNLEKISTNPMVKSYENNASECENTTPTLNYEQSRVVANGNHEEIFHENSNQIVSMPASKENFEEKINTNLSNTGGEENVTNKYPEQKKLNHKKLDLKAYETPVEDFEELSRVNSQQNNENDEEALNDVSSDNKSLAADAIDSKQHSPPQSSKNLMLHSSANSMEIDDDSFQKESLSIVEETARPRTPYPESCASTSTPQTVKRTIKLEDQAGTIENTEPAFNDSLENISEAASTAVISDDRKIVPEPTPPSEEDEQLTLEISTTTDSFDQTIINDIRFINNGVDVTDSTGKTTFIGKSERTDSIKSEDSGGPDLDEDKKAGILNEISCSNSEKDYEPLKSQINPEKTPKNIEESSSEKKVATESTWQAISKDAKAIPTIFSVENPVTTTAHGASKSDHKHNENNEEQSKIESPTLSRELKPDGKYEEDDERTTASANSNHNSGNSFENEADKDDAIRSSAKTIIGEQTANEANKGKVRQFFSDMTTKSKNLSCRNEKTVRVEDEPPKYTASILDEYVHDSTASDRTSKVCTIL